jgi:cephalosporin hydroxylase
LKPYKILKAKIKRYTHHSSELVEKFHEKFYYSKPWADTSWMGTRILKNPADMWVYQEIVFETKPDAIIETGTFNGGSALFFANLFDLMGNGEVITIDINKMDNMPEHKRITYLLGSSYSPEIAVKVELLVKDKKRIMVILDSDHSRDCVYKELNIYAKYVTPGCYLVAEDSNLNGHPVYAGEGVGPGPMEALEEFLPDHNEFEIDYSREKFLITFNPKGFLRRK